MVRLRIYQPEIPSCPHSLSKFLDADFFLFMDWAQTSFASTGTPGMVMGRLLINIHLRG